MTQLRIFDKLILLEKIHKENLLIGETGKTLNNLVENSDLFKFQLFTTSITVEANSTKDVNMGFINTPSGYVYIGVLAVANGFGDQWLVSYGQYGNVREAMVHSRYPVALTQSLNCMAVFVKTNYYVNHLIS